MNQKLFSKFLEKATKKFGDKFDYSKVDYIDSSTKVKIICPIHGEFEQTPVRFLQSKHGCRKCAIQKSHDSSRLTTEEFIEKCKQIWGNRYTYEKTQYINADTKVIISCPIHGDFYTRPADFLRNHGCPKCKGDVSKQFNKKTKSGNLEWFVNKATDIYSNLFDYSQVIYVNSRTKVLIHSNLCNEDFLITPSKFLSGQFKQKYIGKSRKESSMNTSIFVQRARLFHGDKYDYSKVNYIDLNTKVCIICPEHGEFWQTPVNHLYNFQGCPICSSSKGEVFVKNILDSLNIQYTRQYKININGKNLIIDFCTIVNKKLIFIEYNGIQHYEPVEYFGGIEKFQKQVERDKILREYCLQNDIKLVEIKYDVPFKNIENLIKQELEQC